MTMLLEWAVAPRPRATSGKPRQRGILDWLLWRIEWRECLVALDVYTIFHTFYVGATELLKHEAY